MADLDLSVQVLAPDGWHELEDEANGYEMHADSFVSRQTPRRNVESDGDWIDGTFARRSTRGNVVEPVVIIVSGSTPFEFAARMKAAKSWFDQVNYQVKVRFGDAQELWSCTRPGEYTEETAQAMRFATQGVLRVQVSHLPDVVLSEV